MKLSIELSDSQATKLREEASRLGLEPTQLVLAAVADLLTAEGSDFESAAKRILEKNEDLYRRLA
ncbi:MAG: DNA-binding protein [Proteobacteria bacterium]|nr:DNA-binding protein [Pseudomonadota bacterium]